MLVFELTKRESQALGQAFVTAAKSPVPRLPPAPENPVPGLPSQPKVIVGGLPPQPEDGWVMVDGVVSAPAVVEPSELEVYSDSSPPPLESSSELGSDLLSTLPPLGSLHSSYGMEEDLGADVDEAFYDVPPLESPSRSPSPST
jgi:hypothetical protein